MSVENPWRGDGTWKGFDYFSDKYKRKLQEYTIRFRYAFPDVDSFVAQFPDLTQIQLVAKQYYPILKTAFGNLLLKWNTSEQCKAMLFLTSRNKIQLFVRLSEVKNLHLEDFFNNDVIQTLNGQNQSSDTSTDKSSTTGQNSSNTANLDFMNEYIGDKDKPIDDSKWKADKNLANGSTDSTNSTTSGTSSNQRNVNGSSSSTLEKKDVQYIMGDILKLFSLAKDPNTEYFYSILRSMMAPIPMNFDTYKDWRGDFRK